jgi:murein L,D-transpeptidase YcbB/YkuD
MAANVAVNPADIVREALEVVGMNNIGNVNTRQTTRFMNANQLVDMTDFKTLYVSNVKEMVKQYQRVAGATALGIRVQNNLQGLMWYARDKDRRGLTVDVAVLNEDVLNEARET